MHDEVFDLFSALEASDEQLDFPTLFASARQGWAATSLEAEHKDMEPLFDLVIKHVPAPKIDPDPAFRMLVTTLEADNFLGRILTGRILSGSIKPNTTIKALCRDGTELETDAHHQGAGLPWPRARGARQSPKPATSSPSPASRSRPWPTPSATSPSPSRSPRSRSIRRRSP